MTNAYDSAPETQAHIDQVIANVEAFCDELRKRMGGCPPECSADVKKFFDIITERASKHDASKLLTPEKEGFDIYTPKLKGMTYGSEEYEQCRKELGEVLKHHYANNSHHPEHYDNGMSGFDIYDLVELWCDWNASVKRHADGDIAHSIEYNSKRFNIAPDIVDMMRNTAFGFGFSLYEFIDLYIRRRKYGGIDDAIITAYPGHISRMALDIYVNTLVRYDRKLSND